MYFAVAVRYCHCLLLLSLLLLLLLLKLTPNVQLRGLINVRVAIC